MLIFEKQLFLGTEYEIISYSLFANGFLYRQLLQKHLDFRTNFSHGVKSCFLFIFFTFKPATQEIQKVVCEIQKLKVR